MTNIDIVLCLNEYRVQALANALGSQTAETVVDKLAEYFDILYQEYVSSEQRAAVEAKIECEESAEQVPLEASRNFAVFHIRENGEDYHFTSDCFRSPMQAAYRYHLYNRGELSEMPETFAAAFIETNPIALKQFSEACSDINSDKRITALVEFDLDESRVSVCDSSDNAWWTYNLRDFSVAAYKAYSSNYYDEDCRREIFNNSFAGKEINPVEDTEDEVPDEDELPAPAMRM